jgi:hypothetical protein
VFCVFYRSFRQRGTVLAIERVGSAQGIKFKPKQHVVVNVQGQVKGNQFADNDQKRCDYAEQKK